MLNTKWLPVAHGRLSFWSVKLTKDGSQKENYVVTHVKGCDKERLPQRAITNSAPEILANTFVSVEYPFPYSHLLSSTMDEHYNFTDACEQMS